MDAAIAYFKANPSQETYEAVFAALEATAVTLRTDDCWYALRNMGRGKFYMKNISSRLTSSTSLISSGAGQHFRFVGTGTEGHYYVQCAKDMSYLSPTGAGSQQLTLVADRADAGVYAVSSNLHGQSFLVCQNPSGANVFLSLGEMCDKVLPSSATDAARWYIEETAFVPAGMENRAMDVSGSDAIFDLSGRPSKPTEKGFFIIGSKKVLMK